MANRKLSLPLFAAKTRILQSGCSTHSFHFIVSVRQERNEYDRDRKGLRKRSALVF